MSDEPSRQMHADRANHLCLILKAQLVPIFFPILQKGFTQKIKVGCSLMALLSDQFGLSAEYIENRIQTIFLNGKPVDDMDTATIRDGSSLALSSAMPGVLGATLRRGGYYFRMRSQITHVETAGSPQETDGQIVVKLFNLTIRELGPMFLERGIWIDPEELKDFFKSQSHDLGKGCIDARVDGRNVDLAKIPSWDFAAKRVYLQIQIV
jgi:hypothetical protein